MGLYFYKGNENIFGSKKEQGNESSEENDLKKIQDSFLKVLDNKNVSFLLGSGCSSYEIDTEAQVNDTEIPEQPVLQDSDNEGQEMQSDSVEEHDTKSNDLNKETSEEEVQKVRTQVGIPVMAPLAIEFYQSDDFKKEKEWLKTKFNIDVTTEIYKTNLEAFLSTLHSLSFYYSNIISNEEKENSLINIRSKTFDELTNFEKIESIILKVRGFLLKKCLNEKNIKSIDKEPSNDYPLVELYKQFYRKLLTRNPTLPRLSIFTTNYDLYSERAMDLLGIHYVNGFTGGISKFFNPAIFNYALAEKMDLSQSKWNVIDNFFYLYKLHGSVNWIEAEAENKLFKVKEIQDPTFDILESEESIMIHPTPLKYNASLGSPYSDLFREFQKKLMRNNNILVTIGYSFSDEHINNLIFQAFTIPSFRLIVIGEPKVYNEIGKLLKMNDPRIWIIGGSNNSDLPLHYFKRFVEDIMPDLTAEDLDKKMEATINSLKDLLK